ncbi:MAG: hypothetical protein ACRCU5_12880 [Rhizobiaceae bacterium]
MKPVKTRIVLHFPGFEPLDAAAHRERFQRATKQTSNIWNIGIVCRELNPIAGGGAFEVKASGPDWACETHYHVFDLSAHIAGLQSRPLANVITSGFAAFAKVIVFGGTFRYFLHAWRFGLFSVFPFVLMSIGLALAGLVMASPLLFGRALWNVAWSAPLALAFFAYLFMPFAKRFHTKLLFNDWICAVDFATLRDQELNACIAGMVTGARAALREPADEYLIVSHSIGGNAAVHVLGQLIDEEPELLRGKNIVFASLGSGILQSALLAPARVLRHRVGLIAAHKGIFWFDVQCLTDVSHFYKTAVAELCGHDAVRQPTVMTIRIKTMLSTERYARIKRDLLRVHRQYVLGNDVKANYDFALMCAGPLNGAQFASLGIEDLPPIKQDGSLGHR